MGSISHNHSAPDLVVAIVNAKSLIARSVVMVKWSFGERDRLSNGD